MSESSTTRMQQRVKALYRYAQAMEHGDADAISTVLYEAEHDHVLERMIMETNEGYQIEDRTVAHADDIEIAQEMLREILPMEVRSPGNRQEPHEILPAQRQSIRPSITQVYSTKAHRKERSMLGQLHMPEQMPGKNVIKYRYSWLAGLVAALLILVAWPGTGALANQFLALFRVQQFQAVSVDSQQTAQTLFSQLQNVGNLQQSYSNTEQKKNLTRAEAEKIVGHQIYLPGRLPTGVGSIPRIIVNGGSQATYTFDANKARAYLAKAGQSSLTVPAQLDGASFTITTAPGVNISYFTSCDQSYEHCQAGTPFMLHESPDPVIQGKGGASLNQLRDFMLTLPNLSTSARELLKHADEKTGTIPVPIPPQASADQANVNGATALLLRSNGMSAVVWEKQGMVYLLSAGISDQQQLLDAANSLS